MRAPDFSASRLLPGVDLTAPGKRAGAIGLLHSDNENPLGVYPVAAMCIVGGAGPTVLLLAGVHGDEYEGPVTLTRLYQALEPGDVTGRLIFLPQVNAPACARGTRVSPLDGGNLNRAFPGAADGGPTAQIAHLVSACLLPVCDAVIDLHSGGKASWFTPCALAARGRDGAPDAANMALARAFGADVIWQLGAANDDRSVNGAATALGIACIAAELGGGGHVGIDALRIGQAGLRTALMHLGVLHGTAPHATPRSVELSAPGHRVTAPVAGVYVPARAAGADIAQVDTLGQIVTPAHPDAAPTDILAETSGLILAETRRAEDVPGALLSFLSGAS